MPKTTRSTGRLTVDIYSLPASALPALIAAIPLEGDVSISISVELTDEPASTPPAVYQTGGPLTEGGPIIGTPPGGASAASVVLPAPMVEADRITMDSETAARLRARGGR
jgi:hypothetical protein